MSTQDTQRRFRVALSFSGEEREYIREVAAGLASHFGKDKVFFDEYFDEQMGRPNLDTFLQDIYLNQADLVVQFSSGSYADKTWPGKIESRAIRQVTLDRENDLVLVSFEEGLNIDGTFSVDGYIPAHRLRPSEVAELVIKRHKQRGILSKTNGRSSQPKDTPITSLIPQTPTNIGRHCGFPLPSLELEDSDTLSSLHQIPTGPVVDFIHVSGPIVEIFRSVSNADPEVLLAEANKLRHTTTPKIPVRALRAHVAGNMDFIGKDKCWNNRGQTTVYQKSRNWSNTSPRSTRWDGGSFRLTGSDEARRSLIVLCFLLAVG